ncbi:hypothetical protein [Amycolatopsis sp. CA-126428]|nr:hypothetical protein [Amycolatopsis sp. CA-126428]
MSDFAYTLMLIGGFVVLALALRAAERWCEAHPRRNDVRLGHNEQN